MPIKIGCQLNCWPQGPDFGEGFVTAVREAGEIGYVGVETNWRMIDTWGDRMEEFQGILDGAGVVLSALFFGVASASETDRLQELADARRAASFLEQLGVDRMAVGGGKATDDPEVFKDVCAHLDALGKAVLEEHGVKACYHLHHGVLACSPEEIARMMDLTDERYWFLCPDSGIMVKAGHDLVALIGDYAPRIAYVHFKDWDGGDSWAMLGEGVVDHAGALRKLDEIGYDGWVISENESRTEGLTPKQQEGADREWLRGQGY